jgi:hypothetical protein
MRRTGTEPWVCAISVEEIWRGLRPEEEPVARRMFNGLRQADCLIAAAAVGIGAALATANTGDFPMSDLSVEHWLAGT